MKAKKNKGFSLVELIVVIAIMAVLVGILAPQYMKYVEKARIQTCYTNMNRVVKNVQLLAFTDLDFMAGLSAAATSDDTNVIEYIRSCPDISLPVCSKQGEYTIVYDKSEHMLRMSCSMDLHDETVEGELEGTGQ